MKAFFRMFKPFIKKVLIAQLASNQEFVVNEILKRVKLPMSGEQEELVVATLYDAMETVISEQIDKI